jgi:carbohydrate-selective porin OprB
VKKLLALILLAALASQASAAMAMWTGRIEYVTTVTMKPGVKCWYQYMGQTFAQVFVDTASCPLNIEIQ